MKFVIKGKIYLNLVLKFIDRKFELIYLRSNGNVKWMSGFDVVDEYRNFYCVYLVDYWSYVIYVLDFFLSILFVF